MDTTWYYVGANRSPAGPYTHVVLERLYADGKLTGDTLVWQNGMEGWMPYSKSGLRTRVTPPIPPPIPQVPAAAPLDPPVSVTLPDTHVVEHAHASTDSDISSSTPKAKSPEDKAEKTTDYGSAQPPEQPVDDDGWQCTKPAPWRRYFARMLDTIIVGALIWFVLAVLFASFDTDLYQAVFGRTGLANNEIISTILTFALVAPVEALLIGTTGTTLGKWMFGVRITDSAGRAIGFLRACRREADAFLRGLGLGIPLISFITCIVAYRKLKDDGATTWDENQDWTVTYRRNGALQITLFILGVVIFFVILIALQAANTNNG